MRPRSLVRQEFTKPAAPAPRTRALPRCETSKTPAASRTAACSRSTPPPAYSSGISQPPKAASLAPSATWRSCSGERKRSWAASADMPVNLPVTLQVVIVAGTPFPRRHRAGTTRPAGAPKKPPAPKRPRSARVSQPSLSLVDTDPAESAVDAIVIGLHSQPDEGGALLPAAGAESIAAAFDGKLTATLALLGASGAAGEVTKLATLGTIAAPLVVAVGLGDEPSGPAPDPETLRRAAGAAVRALAGSGTVVLALPDDAGAPGALRAILEGALLGSYRF